MAEKVRYQVLKKVFVNNTMIDPKGRKDVFVYAAPGLEGQALKLAPEKGKKPAAAPAGDGNGKSGAGGQSAAAPAGEGGGEGNGNG